MFKKRRQRVKKYTLVSYGTGENELDNEDQIEEEAKEVSTVGFDFVATSDSELEEEYSVYRQQQYFSLSWENFQDMEGLPETKGKGVRMFAQRRQRMDEIALQHEEMRSKGIPVEAISEAEHREIQDTYNTEETYRHADQASQNYMDTSLKQNLQYQENIQQMNHQYNVPRPLVPNRTAKPFLGFQGCASTPQLPGVAAPVTKKHELKFKVPVPINTSPDVWSPTGDIIASRDERISVPAIKTGILPESKRRGTNKQSSTTEHAPDSYLQKQGERRSYIEPEEDFFSLGAEACNFMQPRTVKLKNPPPVAPKPNIDPACPPWLAKSTSLEPFHPPRSPVSPSSRSPVGPHTQPNLQQQDWDQAPQMVNRWAPVQTQTSLQMPSNAWAPVSSSPQPQPAMNSWSLQPPRSPVSTPVLSPTYSPLHPPSPSRNKSASGANSVASCPPQAGTSYSHASKAAPASPKGQALNRGISRAAEGPTMTGKGAELFAKRQSRMEKFVVDAETVQANKTRSPSPTSSLPTSWRYSSNVRAPPPLSYNPLLAPFYPPSAAKQPPSTSPKINPKTKAKPKVPTKHLNSLDVMKHQPYQLDSSLFKYDAVTEAKGPNPKTPPALKSEVIPTPKSSSSHSYSPHNASDLAVPSKSKSPKPSGSVSSQFPSTRQNTRSTEPLSLDKQLDEKPTVTSAARHITKKQAPSVSHQLSLGDSLASAFSPASLIARGARQMAPRPRFSAKKTVATGKHWKPVVMQH
uniref:Synaptopodin 2b n=1 Tax=Myripristis murdjan TaxID=586833 RepID=A0A668AL55_9TELE